MFYITPASSYDISPDLIRKLPPAERLIVTCHIYPPASTVHSLDNKRRDTSFERYNRETWQCGAIYSLLLPPQQQPKSPVDASTSTIMSTATVSAYWATGSISAPMNSGTREGLTNVMSCTTMRKHSPEVDENSI